MTNPPFSMSVASYNVNDPALPNYRRPELIAVQEDLDLVAHLLGGSRVMWRESTRYIPKWPDEHEDVWKIRRQGETLFGGFDRTLSASNGMLFAKPPTMEFKSLESTISEDWENLDNQGTHGDVLMKRYSHMALKDGLAVTLVDHTPQPLDKSIVNSDSERALGLRPTWAIYPRGNCLSWRHAIVGGKKTLTQITFYEPGEVEAGIFGVTAVHRYRVLRLLPEGAAWTLYEQVKQTGNMIDSFRIAGSGYFRNKLGQIAPRLPIGIAYTGETVAPMTATIPLLAVAFANLAHWQISSALRFYLDLCAYPQPVVVGEIMQQMGIDRNSVMGLVPGKLRVGPGTAVHLKEGGEFKWSELEGKSIEALERAIDTKLHAMAKGGVSFLMKDIRGVETAEAHRLEATAENSSLVTSSRGVQDGINEGLQWHAWYYGESDKMQTPTYTLNRDFDNTTLDAQTMLAYVTAVDTAKLPIRILLDAWQVGGRISPDANLDLIEQDMKLAIIAAKEQARLDVAAKAESDRLNAGKQKVPPGGGPSGG